MALFTEINFNGAHWCSLPVTLPRDTGGSRSPVGSRDPCAPRGKTYTGSGYSGSGSPRFAAQKMTRLRFCGAPYWPAWRSP